MFGINNLRKRFILNLPVNPDNVSGLSVLLSVLGAYFIFKSDYLPAALVLFTILVLDLLDGMISRGRKTDPGQGQIADWAADRVSEAIVFVPLTAIYSPLSLLIILNIFLNFLLLDDKLNNRLAVLPLRHVLLTWLLYTVFI